MTPPPGPAKKFSPAAVVAIVVLAIVVVGVFGFFFLGTTKDSDDTATSSASSETVGSNSGDETAVTAPKMSQDDENKIAKLAGEITDKMDYCRGAFGIMPLERALAKANLEGDIEAVRDAIDTNRTKWDTAVEDLRSATTGSPGRTR